MLGHDWSKFAPFLTPGLNENFSKKSGSVTVEHLSTCNFMYNFSKFWSADQMLLNTNLYEVLKEVFWTLNKMSYVTIRYRFWPIFSHIWSLQYDQWAKTRFLGPFLNLFGPKKPNQTFSRTCHFIRCITKSHRFIPNFRNK